MAACDDRTATFLTKADFARPDDDLRKLREPTDPSAVAQLARQAAAGLLVRPIASVVPSSQPVTLHDVAQVNFADSDDPAAVIVRLARRPAWGPDTGLRIDTVLAPALGRAGVSVPSLLAVDLSRSIVPTDVQIQTIAPGVCIQDMDHDDARICACFPALAAALLRVGSIPVRGAGPIDPMRDDAITGVHAAWTDFLTLRLAEHADTCLAAGLIDGAERRWIDQAFDRLLPAAAARPMGLVHGDPSNFNVFAAGDVLTLVDWEDALAGDPLMDLANWTTFHPDRRWPAIDATIPGLGPNSADVAERSLFWLYFLRLVLAKTVQRVRFAKPDLPGRQPASRRIQRALAELAGLGVISGRVAGGVA